MSNNRKIIPAIPLNKLMTKTAISKHVAARADVSEESSFHAIRRYITHLEKAGKIHRESQGRQVHYKFTKESIRYLKETKYKKDFPTLNGVEIDFNKLLSSVWVTGSTINGCGNLHR